MFLAQFLKTSFYPRDLGGIFWCVFFLPRKYLDTMGEKLQVIAQNLQRPSW